MTAELVRSRFLAAAVAVLAAAAVWSTHQAMQIGGFLTGHGYRLAPVYALMWVVLVWQLGLSLLNQPATATPRQQRLLDELHVAAIVPVFNEDAGALRACLASMLCQSRLPQTVVVVDDGSPTGDGDPGAEYDGIRAWFHHQAAAVGVQPVWVRQDNAGKRHAQISALPWAPDADVWWTVDSDTISDPHALGELLRPLADPQVQSVAGIVVAANVRSSLLTRIADLWFVTGQLVDRGALSVLGSVWVNSGAVAVYRASILRDTYSAYLDEKFFGRRVGFSDDSMLTLFSMLRGKTVQQPSAVAFTLAPETHGHFARMFLRWMRGSTIRSLWRVRYLPVRSVAWWLHLSRWCSTAVSAVLFVMLVVVAPIRDPSWAMVPWLIAVPALVGYAQCLRFLTLRRSDQSAAYQAGTWLLTPLAVLWSLLVLRSLRWWGVLTCRRTGWGTRSVVEVTLGSGPVEPPAATVGGVVPPVVPGDAPTMAITAARIAAVHTPR